ncbi:MAG: CaiB/BaiF CoA transferase family protein [Erythrobacter sp.]
MEASDGLPMLEGLKVVDLTSVVFGPYCTQILADFGAEVVKIEAPAGDAYRPGAKPAKTPGMGPGFIALNRGKKSVVLDLKRPEDAAILRGLLSEADVFIHNVRGPAIERLGFNYEAVKVLNPAVIYVHCIGFGSQGRYAGLPAYDDVIQAATGTTSLLSRVDGNPKRRYFPSLIADKVAGLHAVYAVMAALIHRMRTGRGQSVEVPMFESFASFMMKEHLDGLTFDPPNGDAAYGRQVDPDRQPFEMRDGWLSIVPYSLSNFIEVVKLMGDPELAGEERFAEPKGIIAALPELYARIAELARNMTCEDCIARLRPANVPVMPAIDLGAVLEDPHLRETGFFVRSDHPTEGPLWQMREPGRFSDWEPDEPGHAPLLGEHDGEVRKD